MDRPCSPLPLGSVALLLLATAGCTVTRGGPPGSPAPELPEARAEIRELALDPPRSGPSIVAIGPDQSVWVSLARAGKLGRLAPDGQLRTYELPRDSFPVGLLVEPGGVVWYTDIRRNKVARLDPESGSVIAFEIPTKDSWPFQLVRTPEGILYFTERVGNRIGRLDPRAGSVREYTVPTPGAQPSGLTLTPDGHLFFTENSANQVGHLDPATGEVHELRVPSPATPGLYYGPAGITSDAEGNVWFCELDGRLGLIRREDRRRLEEIPLPFPRVRPGGVVVDQWNVVWFTGLDGNMIGSYDPAHGTFRAYPIPSGKPDPQPMSPPEVSARGELPQAGLQAKSTRPFGIAVDAAGRVWFSEQYGHRLGVLTPPALEVVSPAGDIRQPEVAVRTSRRTLASQAWLRYLLDDAPVTMQGRVETALLRPGEHRWTVVASHEGKDVVRASSSFVVTPSVASVERLVAALRGTGELDAAAWERLDAGMRAAREALRDGRADTARSRLRAMLREVEPLESASSRGRHAPVLAQHLRYLDLFGALEVEAGGEACPAELTVQAGDVVTWRNGGTTTLRVVSVDGSFASPEMTPGGGAWSRAFPREGRYEYACRAGSERRAVVKVEARTAPAKLFPMPGPGRVPSVLARDVARNVWFTAGGGGYAGLDVPPSNKVGKLAPDGRITEYETPTAGSAPTSLKVGTDGTIWFTERLGNRLGRLEPVTGKVHEYLLPTANSSPTGLAVAADGSVWFTEKEASQVGRLTPATGEIQEWKTPHFPKGEPSTVVLDHEGQVWFDERGADVLVRMNPRTGEMRQFAVPTRGSRVVGLLPDSRGYVWFLELGAHKVGRLTVETGQVVEYAIPTMPASPFKSALDSYGRLWFTQAFGNRIGVLDEGRFHELVLPGERAMPGGIDIDDEGNVWFALQAGNALGVLPRAAAVPSRLVGVGTKAMDFPTPRHGGAEPRDAGREPDHPARRHPGPHAGGLGQGEPVQVRCARGPLRGRAARPEHRR